MMDTMMITTIRMVRYTPFGSLNEQAVVYKGEIQKREILDLTVLIDHDVIDGVPAARFVDDLVKKLQAGIGLPA
jgi:pyruvate/2-oxoglutarate dehydrogenase complex dihydrolipoamide acyltransferase (E2) component